MKPSARSVLRGSRVRQARCLRDDQRHPNWLAGRERPSRSRSQQRGPGSRGRGWGSRRHSALPAGSARAGLTAKHRLRQLLGTWRLWVMTVPELGWESHPPLLPGRWGAHSPGNTRYCSIRKNSVNEPT